MSDFPAKAPTLGSTDQQRREALALANQVRSARSRLKEQLKQSEVSLAPLIADCPSYLATALIHDLLEALPRYGPRRAGTLLSRCGISPGKTMASLTPRQRQALCEALNT